LRRRPENNFASSKPSKNVRSDASNFDLEVARHYVAVNGDRGSLARLSHVIARSEGVMVVNGETIMNVVPELLSEISNCVSTVNPEDHDETVPASRASITYGTIRKTSVGLVRT
jgi:hypothetical protein